MKHRSMSRISCMLACIFFSSSFQSASAQSGITAIDILLNPDHTMLDSAKVYNRMMQQNYSGPGSYSLDDLHTPHITVLQCFVRTTDLGKVYAAVASVVESEKPTKENLASKGFYYYPTNALGLAGITIDATPALLHFQAKIIEMLKPFIVAGTDAAFVQNANGTPIAAGSSEYVNGYVQDHAGTKYNPHVTIGLAHEDFLKELFAKPYHKFTFRIASVSIYHLGDFGTARTKLWSSTAK
jgi:hypothetical protein